MRLTFGGGNPFTMFPTSVRSYKNVLTAVHGLYSGVVKVDHSDRQETQ